MDSNILSALFCLEPTSDALVQRLGDLRLEGALVVCGAVYAEAHAIPGMTPELLEEFLEDTGIAVEFSANLEDWSATGQSFANYARRRRKTGDGQGKRLLADFVVGAHASRRADRLLTLDPKRYSQDFPKLELVAI